MRRGTPTAVPLETLPPRVLVQVKDEPSRRFWTTEIVYQVMNMLGHHETVFPNMLVEIYAFPCWDGACFQFHDTSLDELCAFIRLPLEVTATEFELSFSEVAYLKRTAIRELSHAHDLCLARWSEFNGRPTLTHRVQLVCK